MVTWIQHNIEGYTAWIGETSGLSVCIIPELGSKVISLVNRVTNREWLWRSGKALGNDGYGSSFAKGDESGWDEMFPSINECHYPEAPWKDQSIPDHGEVWALHWQAHRSGAQLHCHTEGVKFPYSLNKVYSFTANNTLRIDYTLTNNSEAPFSFLWAAHPLLRVHEGMQLHMPTELREIEISYSANHRLGDFGNKQPWPLATTRGGELVDLSIIGPTGDLTAEKYYFTGTLAVGYAALSDPETGESITFRFPVEQVPYLAVWANGGGFGGHYHLAIEPATGRMDDLSHSMKHDEVTTVEGNGTYEWFLEVAII